MSKEIKERYYRIPNNFHDEPRILMGAFKRRNFIEGLILSLLGVIPGLLIPFRSVTARITVLIILAAPFLMIGILGFNGDPLSVAVRNARKYRKEKSEKVYNSSVRLLEYSPTDAMLSKELTRDKVVEAYEGYRKKKQKRIVENSSGGSSAISFEYDPSVDDYVSKKRRDGKSNTSDIKIKTTVKKEKIRITSNQNLSDFNDLYDLDEDLPDEYEEIADPDDLSALD